MKELLTICGSQRIDNDELKKLIGGNFEVIQIDVNTILVIKEDWTSKDDVNEIATRIYSKFLGHKTSVYGNAIIVLNKQYLH